MNVTTSFKEIPKEIVFSSPIQKKKADIGSQLRAVCTTQEDWNYRQRPRENNAGGYTIDEAGSPYEEVEEAKQSK